MKNDFELFIPDTANNRQANWGLADVEYRSKLENQIGLSDLKKGADSLEVRLWYDFSFSNSQELYVFKFRDTICFMSYYRVYPTQFDYNAVDRDRNWDRSNGPYIDSALSKSVVITKKDYKHIKIDSIWFLKSQSHLNIPDNIGFTDCDSCIMEIADKKRFKYLRHHCVMSYYEKTKLEEILNFSAFCSDLVALAREHNTIVPKSYE